MSVEIRSSTDYHSLMNPIWAFLDPRNILNATPKKYAPPQRNKLRIPRDKHFMGHGMSPSFVISQNLRKNIA